MRYVLVSAAILFGVDTATVSGIIIINNKFQEDFGDLDPVTGAFVISAGGQTLLYGLLLTDTSCQ